MTGFTGIHEFNLVRLVHVEWLLIPTVDVGPVAEDEEYRIAQTNQVTPEDAHALLEHDHGNFPTFVWHAQADAMALPPALDP